MAFGSAVGPTGTQYTVVANSVTMVGDYPVKFTAAVSADNLDATGVDTIVQQFVDALVASGHFTISGQSGKTYSYSEGVSPS
jgi:predicted TIM-barrel enzyme